MATVKPIEWETGSGWQCRYYDASGKRRSKNFDTKREANAFKTKVEHELLTGTHVADRASATVAEACDAWLKAGKAGGNCCKGTLAQREQHIRLHIKPFLGDKLLSRLTKQDVTDYTAALGDAGRSVAMVSKVRTSLYGVLELAADNGLMGRNVSGDVERPSDKRSRKRIEVPNPAVAQAMLDAAAGLDNEFPETHPIVLLAAAAGLRSSEARALGWDCVNLNAGHGTGKITVQQTVDDKGTGDIVETVKSSAAFRTIPIGPDVVAVLKRWRLRCPIGDKNPRNLCFPNQRGRPISENNWRDVRWRRIEQTLGTATSTGRGHYRYRYGLHTLRHFYASTLIRDGVDDLRIKTWLGHASYTFTVQQYGHLMVDDDDDAAVVTRLSAARTARGGR